MAKSGGACPPPNAIGHCRNPRRAIHRPCFLRIPDMLEATPGIEPGYTVLQSGWGTSRVPFLVWRALISLYFVLGRCMNFAENLPQSGPCGPPGKYTVIN